MATTAPVYRSPYSTTIAFGVGVLLFFLPFMEIKCNGTSLAQIKGTDMITGASPKMSSEFDDMTKSINKGGTTVSSSTSSKKDGKMYVLAIVALAIGIIGIAVSLIKKGTYNMLESVLGIAGAIALLVLMFQVKADVGDQLKATDKDTNNFSNMVKVTADFTVWFFLCIASYLGAALLNYQRKAKYTPTNLPPASAPQTPINNPGDQSDFPAAPGSGEEGLR